MRVVLIFFALNSLFNSTNAQDITSKIDRYMGEFVAEKDFSGNVFVSKGGEVIFSKSWGFANKEWNVKNNISTVLGLVL